MKNKMKYVAAIFILLLCGGDISCHVKEGEWCVDKTTGATGLCVRPRLCQSADEAFFKRGKRPTFCEYSTETILICCSEKSFTRTTSEQPVWQDNSNKLRALERVSEIKCKEYSKNVSNLWSVIYVYGGTNAGQQDFPHMAAIAWRGPDGEYNFGCGGSLISPRFVLTAGHCASKARAVNPLPEIVRLGNVNLNPESKNGHPIIDVNIKAIYKHPEYRPPLRYNDIALLELAEDVKITNNVRPSCLWTKPGFENNTHVIATGWGVTENSTLPTDTLQMVSLSLYSNERCDPLIPKNRHWKGFAPTQMCAGELAGKKDTCQGDSGAPLQILPNYKLKVYYVMGVTSFGGRCAQKGLPSIYTRVSSYLDWIESVVWPDE